MMRRTATLALTLAALTAPMSVAMAQFNFPSYSAVKVFPNGSPNQHPMGMAWDGSNYWSVDGGGNNGTRITQYDSNGNVVNTYAPGLDFRSVFTNAAGTVFGRQFNDNNVYTMTSPGVFSALVTLTGGNLDAQSSVVLNGAGTQYIAMNNGVVDSWNLSGTFTGAVTLAGYGVNCESCYPENRGIASLGANWLTYDGGTLSMWDPTGNRLGTTTLNGAGQSFDSYFSFSRADDGNVWVADDVSGNWRGYNVAQQGTVTPEPATFVLLGTGLLGVIGVARRKRSI